MCGVNTIKLKVKKTLIFRPFGRYSNIKILPILQRNSYFYSFGLAG